MNVLPISASPTSSSLLSAELIDKHFIDKHQVASAFGRAAHSYEQHNELQRRSGRALLALLNVAQPNPVAIGLDLGCGSGYFVPALKANTEHLLALDLSPAMLQQARLKAEITALCADMDAPPLAERSLDFIFANLCLQWSSNPAAWLTSWSQRLKPGGVLVFATLIEGSLHELKQCWQQQGLPSPINRFITATQLERDLANTGKRWRCHYATEQLAFSDLKALLQSLKGIGANRVNAERRTGLLGKQRWQQLNLTYPVNNQGQSLANYQLAYGVIYG